MNIYKQAFSPTWPAAMQFYWNECLHTKRGQHLQDRFGTSTGRFQYGCRDVILKTLYTYVELVMPLREEWKSSPIRVDLQAVTREEERRVFKTKFVIILLRAVWIHNVLIWSGLNGMKK